MWSDPACTFAAPTAAVADLDAVVHDLAGLGERILEATVHARGLAAATDWRAEAAVVFHERAERWAGEVSGLYCLAETARVLAAEARERVAWAAWQGC